MGQEKPIKIAWCAGFALVCCAIFYFLFKIAINWNEYANVSEKLQHKTTSSRSRLPEIGRNEKLSIECYAAWSFFATLDCTLEKKTWILTRLSNCSQQN